MTQMLLALLTTIGVVAVVFPAIRPPTPRLLWNTTASAPVGFYQLHPVAMLHVGELVAVHPPAPLASALDRSGFLPLGVPLLKTVAALAPSTVCRSGARITVNGRDVARALDRDRFGRRLPTWSGCRQLAASEMFLLNAEPRSLDGRYFGALPIAMVVGRATPLLLSGGRSHVS